VRPPDASDPAEAAPILSGKRHAEPSVFTPAALLHQARRQKALAARPVPAICVLDPDGDLVAHLERTGRAVADSHWACYHTRLHTFTLEAVAYGLVGGAVGAPFAVLVAEELFASGCELLLSVTSAGQIVPHGDPPYFVLIERALRDEGTSYHYLPPAPYSRPRPGLLDTIRGAVAGSGVPVVGGASWTTDAPFRETASAIERARASGVLAVEMEAAALYAFAEATGRDVVCFAHVTNRMGRAEQDFEKGAAEGSPDALRVLHAAASGWLARRRHG
jgi:uridine phosphorylase